LSAGDLGFAGSDMRQGDVNPVRAMKSNDQLKNGKYGKWFPLFYLVQS